MHFHAIPAKILGFSTRDAGFIAEAAKLFGKEGRRKQDKNGRVC